MIRIELLRTRVARRILLLFVLGALAPVVLLGVYAFSTVRQQLRDQGFDRLQQLSKSAGMSIMERLKHAEADLDLVVADEQLRALATSDAMLGDVSSRPLRGLERIVVTPFAEAPDADAPFRELREPERAHLEGGQALLRVRPTPEGGASLWLVKLVDRARPGGELIWARLRQDYLWDQAPDYVDLPSIGGFCVLVGVDALHCQGYDTRVSSEMLTGFRTSPTGGRGVFTWSTAGVDHVGAHWELFLRANYQAESWSIVVGEPADAIFQPLQRFTVAFPPVLLFGLLVVTLLANGLVRRTMDPLDKLTRGTARIASQEFDARVDVDRTDEFGELALSFNEMAERLGVQFHQLEASRAIDQAVLSSTRREDVVDALLSRFAQVLSYERLAVLLLGRDRKEATLYWAGGTERGELAMLPTASDLAYLASGDALIAREGEQPSMLLGFTDARPILVLPFKIKGQITGAVMVGRRKPFRDEEIHRARQIVDQAAVALDQVQLVARLEEMSWGTLRALARAIDAKSKWTGGHAERVASLALAIGEEMKLGASDMETLRRGGLLHDIGKIGIPANVLDSSKELSEDERSVMQGHVMIGARILEPVASYADIIPIVLYHHERWDGTGYPRGLAGEDIPLLARVLAVADTYDAMVSARPYRAALTTAGVHDHMVRLSGRHFDPRIVAALTRVLTRMGEITSAPAPALAATHG
jgi:putative nucleotidyltransferase with HDIG domain